MCGMKGKNQWFGKILDCPNYINELWYVSPKNGRRKLITITNAHIFFNQLVISVDDNVLKKIPTLDEVENNKNLTLRRKYKGKFLSEKDDRIKKWYVDNKLKRIELNLFDYFDFLKSLAVKISKDDLDLIPMQDYAD